MRRQFTHKHTTHTTLIPAFPLTVLPALPTHPTAEPNQPSTTGKNLIMVHPDSTTMDDAFFLLCLFLFLAVQNSSIGDLVTHSVTQGTFTFEI